MAVGNSILRKREENEIMQTVRTFLKTISHGSLTLVIQDGKVLQIDKKEKFRLV